jgi:lactoylglutathione lyase
LNVRQVVPFLGVADMQRSVQFYADGLGFTIKLRWEPDGQLRWCWMVLGGAAVMLQQFANNPLHGGRPEGTLGQGMSLYFICEDAVSLYRDFRAHGIDASEPQVGNGMWVTGVVDPDGYRLFFESDTDTPEETLLSQLKP